MKFPSTFRFALGVASTLFAMTLARAEDDLTATLARLAGGDTDFSVLFELEGHRPEPRILPALEAAFERGKATEEKQRIAATLVRLGDSSSVYFEYLESSAKEAIEDQAPPFLKYDAAGNLVSGEFDTGFLNWCAVNGKNPREVAKAQFGTYPNSVRMLAYAQDSRSRDLLRRGLNSPNPLVIMYSIEGLGRLHDSASLDLISKSIERVRASSRAAVAQSLCHFRDAEAEAMYERFVPNEALRNISRRMIQRLRTEEDDRLNRRIGPPMPSK